MNKKLELQWYGKEEKINVEPRLLIENPELSNIENDKDTENILIHGDNLLALKALEAKYFGKVKCIYIDPPYNTGSAFEHYDDNFEHSTWLSLMKPRLEILRNLLSDDGSIWIQIDDEEQAYLKVLCDEVFGRKNFINMLSVNMKNIAGASGGGEDKRLKKNCEYILIYSKNYEDIKPFTGAYQYTEMSELIQQYIDDGKSWKYTSVFIDRGEKVYHGSTIDGDGNEIKVFIRSNSQIKSINQLSKEEKLTVKDSYKKYGKDVFRTTNSQSSIRTRIVDYKKENNIEDSILSIEYIPKTGKNKGILYEQFYKEDNLVVWLKDTSEIIEEVLYKKDLLGTYWDMNAYMKNVASEGKISFPKSKKPESLIERIIKMSTNENDLVLDSFLGSGTTAAVAHKMNRKWIGIEMGDHAYTHCKVRLDKVISGEDQGGISKSVNWQGGGSYRFFELAPTLIKKDDFGIEVINEVYDAEMLASAVALHEGYKFNPSSEEFWKQSSNGENSYLYVTTNHISTEYLMKIKESMQDNEFLLIACKSFDEKISNLFKNIEIKKIPQMLLQKCEFGKEHYNLNIVCPPVEEEEEEID